jgi:hypothetical protein
VAEGRVGAAGGDPRRQNACELAEPVEERRRVGEHVHPLFTRGGHHLDRALPAPVGRTRVLADVEMRDLGANASGAGDLRNSAIAWRMPASRLRTWLV